MYKLRMVVCSLTKLFQNFMCINQSVGNDKFKYVLLVLRLSFRIKSPSCIKIHPCMIFFKIAKFSSNLKYFTIPVCRKLRSLLFEYETHIKNKQACSEINPGPSKPQ